MIDLPLTALRQKGKRQNPKETRGRFNVGTPISKRPKEVNNRKSFAHWGLDTVVSGRGYSQTLSRSPQNSVPNIHDRLGKGIQLLCHNRI